MPTYHLDPWTDIVNVHWANTPVPLPKFLTVSFSIWQHKGAFNNTPVSSPPGIESKGPPETHPYGPPAEDPDYVGFGEYVNPGWNATPYYFASEIVGYLETISYNESGYYVSHTASATPSGISAEPYIVGKYAANGDYMGSVATSISGWPAGYTATNQEGYKGPDIDWNLLGQSSTLIGGHPTAPNPLGFKNWSAATTTNLVINKTTYLNGFDENWTNFWIYDSQTMTYTVDPNSHKKWQRLGEQTQNYVMDFSAVSTTLNFNGVNYTFECTGMWSSQTSAAIYVPPRLLLSLLLERQ